MFIYNAIAMPLVISFLSIAVLWRGQHEATVPAPAPRTAQPLPERSA